MLAFVFTEPVLAQDARALETLKQARAAIGGEDLLKTIQALGIKGEYRRFLGEREMAGDREVSILLPDKYLVEDAFSGGGMATAMINTRGLNSEHAWNGNSGGGGGMFIRMAGAGGAQPSPEQIETMLRKQYTREYTRYLLAILLAPPPSFAVEYKYAGESDVEEAHAEVVEVTGAENFSVRLFFDKQTHLPLLLSYRGPKPRIMTMTRPVADKKVKPEDAIKQAQADAEKKMATGPVQNPEEVDFFIRLTDYKKVEGLLLPHKLTSLTEADVSEEFVVSKYLINPTFKADRFQKH
ncbi:MAG TPA: hypothetical protein VK475_10100 [Pyrinomonadaceae bacterium]|nr:hypothetical protein [Pyrinomonadaceae bacterium]